MTNLEYYKDEVMEHCCLCEIAWICKYGKCCPGNSCNSCEFDYSNRKCLEVILAEHKEPNKLKQWEYDLLTIFENHAVNDKLALDSAIIIAPMLRAGYFKGVHDTSMTIKDILENCEVVD